MPVRTVSDADYCDGMIGDRPVTGWIIRRYGKPAYFQIEGRDGLCVAIDKVADLKPVAA
jgi:hypothetical protein